MAINMKYYVNIYLCFGVLCHSSEIRRQSFKAGETFLISCDDQKYQSTIHIVNISIQNPRVTCPYSEGFASKLHELLNETNQRCNTKTRCDVTVEFPMEEPTFRDMNMYYICKDNAFGCNYSDCNWTLHGFSFWTQKQNTTSLPTFIDTTKEQIPFAYSMVNGSYLRSPPMKSGPKCLSLEYSSLSANIVVNVSSSHNTKDSLILASSFGKIQNKIDLEGTDNSSVVLMMRTINETSPDVHIRIYNIALQEGPCNDEMTIYVDFDTQHYNEWIKFSTHVNYSWTRRSGKEAGSYYGMVRPFFDHSTQQGNNYYLTMEVIDYAARERYVRATFESPVYFGNNKNNLRSLRIGCLQFWYYMYGDNSSTLVIWRTFNDKDKQNLTSISNNELSGIWKKHSLTLMNLIDENMKIAFEGVISKNRSSIALDDISIRYGRCPEENHFIDTINIGPLCKEPSSTSRILPCISDENRVNIGFEPDILQTSSDDYKKCKDMEKEIEIRFNSQCKRNSTIAEISKCAQQIQKEHEKCMIIPLTINVDYICLGNIETTHSPDTTLQDQEESTQKTSTAADNLHVYTANSPDQSASSSMSKGIVIGVTSGILIVAVAITIAVLVIKRSTILRKFKRTPTAVDKNAFKMDKQVSTNGNKEKKAIHQFFDAHRSGNYEHVYNTIKGESGTENNNKNSSKYQIDNRVPGANDKDGYAVLKEVNIYDQITHDEQNGSSSKVLSNDMNAKQFDNEQSNDYLDLDPNESGHERKGKNQSGIRCSDEENHDYQTLTPDEVKPGPIDYKIEKNNDYGILDPNETGFDRSGLSIMTENTTLHLDTGSKVTPELALEDYSVRD